MGFVQNPIPPVRHKCVYHSMSAPHSKKLWSYQALTRETHSNMHLKSENINHETTGKYYSEVLLPPFTNNISVLHVFK
jgi:hypothetical protein